jgi:citrate lyase beta subunit
MAIAAASIQAIDTVWTDVRDDESLRREAQLVRDLWLAEPAGLG